LVALGFELCLVFLSRVSLTFLPELPLSCDPPISAYGIAEITGVNHHTQPL
jgi:hypothetical protein